MIIDEDGEADFNISEGGHNGKKRHYIGHIYFTWMGKEHKYRVVVNLEDKYRELIFTKKEGEAIEKFLRELVHITGGTIKARWMP